MNTDTYTTFLAKYTYKRLNTFTDNEDHAINLATLLGNSLRESRPFLESINHNGARIMEKMPSVLDEVRSLFLRITFS